MAQRWKVALACAFGSAVGSFVALEIYRPVWWIGLLVGAITGYLSYDPAKVFAAFKQAFGTLYRVLTLKIWIPDAKYWLKLLACMGMGMIYIWTAYTGLFLLLAGVSFLGTEADRFRLWDPGFLLAVITIFFWYVPIGVVTFGFSFICIPDLFRVSDWQSRGKSLDDCPTDSLDEAMTAVSWQKFLMWNPITVYCLLLPGYTVKGLIWFLPFVAEGCFTIIKGNLYVYRIVLTRIALFFLLIHCERRLLCGLYSVCGALIGYQSGSVLLGACAGGLIGLVVHELVERVSDRIVPVDLPASWFT